MTLLAPRPYTVPHTGDTVTDCVFFYGTLMTGFERPGRIAGLAMGYAQANLVILPEKYAFDFLLFCQRNPKPCPLLEVLEPGKYRTEFLSQAADIRTDIPRFNIYRKGKLEATVKEIKHIWKPDFVTFLLGCSFSFEEALIRSKIPVRHIEENKNVPMFISNIACKSSGVFHGPMVVTMRPIPPDKVSRAVQITSRYVSVHGAPVHIGDTLGKKAESPDVWLSVRQGILLAILAVGLLLLQSFRILIWWDGMLVVAAVFLAELYFLSRK